MTGAAIARGLEEVDATPSVTTIGSFDGVHRGHQELVTRTLARAAEERRRSVVVTFDRHPMEVVRPDAVPPLLTTVERRVATLAATGVDLLVVLPFTAELAQLPPEAFVDDVLIGRLDTRRVVVGRNFRFGHRAAGDVDLLRRLGAERGVAVDPVELLELDGAPISSSEIRRRVAGGDVAWAARALGRPFAVEGEVVAGEARGQALGVPTANVAPRPGVLLPGNGIYAGHVEVDGGRHPAVTSVGVRPTFGGRTVTVEAHLLDFSGDIYGRHVLAEFAHRLRDEERFDTVDELVAAMHRDIARGRELLASGS